MYRTQCVMVFLALYVGLGNSSWEAYSRHRRQALDEVNYDDPLQGDEATDDMESSEPQPKKNPAIIETSPTQYEVEAGEDVRLECKVTPEKGTLVAWYKNNQPYFLTTLRLHEDVRYSIAEGSKDLIIKNAQADDSGVFRCETLQTVPVGISHTLLVTQKPEIISKPQVHVPKAIVNSDIEIEAILQCTAHGEVRPNIRWYKDGVLIEHSTKYVISTQGSQSKLTVSPSVDGEFGTFTCEAENQYGTHNRSIDLVERPVIEDLDMNEPRMNWTVHSHQPVEEMKVQLRPTTDDGESTSLGVPLPEAKHQQDKQLQPGEYLADVKVKNSKNWGSTEPAAITIHPQSLYIQSASVYRENAAHSIRPVYTALSTILMYLLVRML